LRGQTIDDVDRELIALLHHNAREPVASLARKLSISRTTVQDRLKRLEVNGVIAGYTLRVTAPQAAAETKAFVLIAVDTKADDRVAAALKKLPAVQQLHTISGAYDLCAMISAASHQEMDRWLDRIRDLPGVEKTLSNIVLTTKLDR